METTDDQNGFFLVQLHLLSGDGERSVEPLFESVASLGGKGRWVKLKETKRSTKNKLFLDLIRQTPALKKRDITLKMEGNKKLRRAQSSGSLFCRGVPVSKILLLEV